MANYPRLIPIQSFRSGLIEGKLPVTLRVILRAD